MEELLGKMPANIPVLGYPWAGVDVGIGEGPTEMHQALGLCRHFNGQPGIPKLYASAGVYPHNTPELDDSALAKLDSLLAEPEVIACGEIGLDYYHEGAPHEVLHAHLQRVGRRDGPPVRKAVVQQQVVPYVAKRYRAVEVRDRGPAFHESALRKSALRPRRGVLSQPVKKPGI